MPTSATAGTRPINPAISPGVAYRDAQAGIRWLTEVLGFTLSSLYEEDGGKVCFAQLVWRDGAIQVSTREESPRLPRSGPASIVLTAEDAAAVDRIHRQAVAVGAEILLPLEDTFYGSHGFTVRDPEGNQWHLGTPWLGSQAADSLPQRRL